MICHVCQADIFIGPDGLISKCRCGKSELPGRTDHKAEVKIVLCEDLESGLLAKMGTRHQQTLEVGANVNWNEVVSNIAVNYPTGVIFHLDCLISDPLHSDKIMDVISAVQAVGDEVVVSSRLMAHHSLIRNIAHTSDPTTLSFRSVIWPWANDFEFEKFVGRASMFSGRGYECCVLVPDHPSQNHLLDYYKQLFWKFRICVQLLNISFNDTKAN